MLRSLLSERFKLTLHSEIKELPLYELVVARAGLKITATKDGSCVPRDANTPPALLMGLGGRFCDSVERKGATHWPQRIDRIDGTGISMTRLIEVITDDVSRTVLDKTGFTPTFDVHLEFVPNGAIMHTGPYPSAGAARPGDPATPAASAKFRRGQSIFAAVQAQLGLQLRSAKGPVSLLVIDHAERASEN